MNSKCVQLNYAKKNKTEMSILKLYNFYKIEINSVYKTNTTYSFNQISPFIFLIDT